MEGDSPCWWTTAKGKAIVVESEKALAKARAVQEEVTREAELAWLKEVDEAVGAEFDEAVYHSQLSQPGSTHRKRSLDPESADPNQRVLNKRDSAKRSRGGKGAFVAPRKMMKEMATAELSDGSPAFPNSYHQSAGEVLLDEDGLLGQPTVAAASGLKIVGSNADFLTPEELEDISMALQCSLEDDDFFGDTVTGPLDNRPDHFAPGSGVEWTHLRTPSPGGRALTVDEVEGVLTRLESSLGEEDSMLISEEEDGEDTDVAVLVSEPLG